jgi:glutamate dehydrogenase
VKAYLLAREVFDSVGLWQEIESLDTRVADDVQREMIVEWRALIHRATGWFLRSRHLNEAAGRAAERLAPAVSALRHRLEPEAGSTPQVTAWVQAGVPAGLARQVGAADRLFSALDIAEIAESAHCELDTASQVHFGAGERLGLERLRQQIDSLATETHWQTLAKVALADELADLQRSIALDVLTSGVGPAAQRLASWEERSAVAIARVRRLQAELAEAPMTDLAMLSVALREIRQLA